MRTRLFFSSFLFLTFGCSPDEVPAPIEGLQVIVAGVVTNDGCEESPNGAGSFPQDVDAIVMQVAGGEGYSFTPQRFNSVGDNGTVLVEAVPPGEDLTLSLYGCKDGQSEPVWSGGTPGLNVEANTKTTGRVFLTKKNAASCTGRNRNAPAGFSADLNQPRAFHSVVQTAAGNMLVIGGFTVYEPQNASSRYLRGGDVATSTVTEYRSSRGLFAEWSESWDSRLLVPRGLHHTVPIDGGKAFLVIGGITRAAISPPPAPPLMPIANGNTPIVPSQAVETVNAEARTVSASGLQFGPLPYSAAAWSPNGETIVLSGGRLEGGAPSNKLQYVTGDAALLSGGDAQVVTKQSNPPVARMGHTATWFADGQVLLLGGNTDDNLENLMEVLSGEQFDTTAVTIENLPADMKPMALHQTAHVRSSADGCEHHFLIAGGMTLTGASNPIWVSPSSAGVPARLHTLSLDTCQGPPYVADLTDQSAVLGSSTRARRVFHQMTGLGEDLFMLSGGMNQLAGITDENPDCAGDTSLGCYLSDVSLLSVDADLAVTVTRQSTYRTAADGDARDRARFGHNTALLPDGSVLTTGGLEAVSDQQSSLITAPEILNPLRPSELTACQQ